MHFIRSVTIGLACSLPVAAFALVHENKEVSLFHSPDTRECVFFQLNGVSEADPVTPGVSWFAIPKTHAGYKEIVAALVLARHTGKPLRWVATCGHAAVHNIGL
jgi:hypothetical protein